MGIMTTPLKSESLDIATFYKPVAEVGGDLISIDQIDSDRIRFFLADTMGHGVQAALVTMLILSEFQNLKNKSNSPGEILTAPHAHYLKFYLDIRAIFTAVVVDWNLKEKSLLYSSASHLPQLLSLEQRQCN